ncbi:MAG: epimerase [Pseudomonadota bacterium]
MQKTALILGASGRFGRNAALSFEEAGWEVRRFDRQSETLWDAAWGANVIVNAWNPAYTDWESTLPGLTRQVIEVAQASGAQVVIPGNVYVYGEDAPDHFTKSTPHKAENSLGRLRRDMEEAYRASGIKTLILRAGDFIDTNASGNWFDKVITAEIDKGVIRAPGDFHVKHAWAYLPDLTRAMVQLCERRDPTPQFEDILFDGYTLSLSELNMALEDVFRREFALKPFAWWQVQLARPFWPLAKHLLEMQYLWNKPHSLSGTDLRATLPSFRHTPVEQALRDIFEMKIYPDEPVTRSGFCSRVRMRPGYARV